MKRLAASAVLLTLALTAGSASAFDSRSQEIALKGVDFSDRAAVERLYHQLRVTAKRVCRDPVPNAFGMYRDAECATRALDKAVAAIDRPQLRLVHSGGAAPVQVARNER